jgi:hypothetical protein
MSRRYGDPIGVKVERGAPVAFTWRGRHYTVTVIGIWRLTARWWNPATAADRTYYRVQTPDWEVFELYHDAVPDAWVLDICQD